MLWAVALGTASVEFDTEPASETLAPLIGHGHRAIPGPTHDPTKLEQPCRQGSTQGPSDMQLALAPVKAATNQRASPAGEDVHVDAKLSKPRRLITNAERAVGSHEHALLFERPSQGHPQAARQVVIAGPPLPDEPALRCLA